MMRYGLTGLVPEPEDPLMLFQEDLDKMLGTRTTAETIIKNIKVRTSSVRLVCCLLTNTRE